MSDVQRLVVQDLRKTYSPPSGPIEVLRGVSFILEPGEAVAVMGPSGCGKSTLLHLLGVLDPPSSGSITLGGIDPYSLSAAEQALFRNRRIGYIFQDHCLLPQLSVLENVLTPLLVGGEDHTGEDRALALLEEVGMSHRITHRPGELSGGEQQRVAIARALIRQPGLLLCDEPTGNLDRANGDAVAGMLDRVRNVHKTAVVVVTHSPEIAARFDRTLTLRDGLIARG
jgi:lipoprotein-releasing system ATP-binding protein